MTEEADRKNADEARGDSTQQRKKAYMPPELVKRGPVAKVAAVTLFIAPQQIS